MLSISTRSLSILGAAITALAIVQSAGAAAITAGDVLIYRVGTVGGSALSAAGASVFLDEYSPTGTLVQSIAVPATGAAALTAIGNSTSEGIVSASQDGTRLVFAGYRTDAGTAAPSVATVGRVIGTVNLTGTVDTSVGITGLPAGNIRSATTNNGSTYYIGTSGQVGYIATPGAASTVTTIDARNSRQVLLASTTTGANTLIASNGSTAVTGKVQSYGNAPTAVTAATPIVTLASTDAVNGIFLLDLNAGVAGADTLYALSTVETLLRKYTFDGTNWIASGSIATTALNLTAGTNGTNVSLFLTTGSSLLRLNDTSGYGGTLVGSLTTIATASTGTGFRGIGGLNVAFTAVPEPMSLGAFAIAGTVIGRRRR